jgi:hypothetical protein
VDLPTTLNQRFIKEVVTMKDLGLNTCKSH